jgi:hypothetical protein
MPVFKSWSREKGPVTGWKGSQASGGRDPRSNLTEAKGQTKVVRVKCQPEWTLVNSLGAVRNMTKGKCIIVLLSFPNTASVRKLLACPVSI